MSIFNRKEVRELRAAVNELSVAYGNLLRNCVLDIERKVQNSYAQEIDHFKVDARHTLMRTEQAVAAKLAEMDVPRYDWNETAAGIIKRLNSIEVQLTKIRMKQEEHEQTFVTLGAKLRA